MTTILEIAERLARRTKAGTITGLGMAAAMDIVEAINAGLQECFELLPNWQRRTTVSFTLPAPVTVNLSVVNGSVELAAGGSVFLEEQIGRSVLITGDGSWNEVQGITSLLDEFQGATGVVPAVIYGDSLFNNISTFDGLLSHPRFADSRKGLMPFNPRQAGRPAEIGRPKFYWIEPSAASLGGVPSAFLRVFPAPDRAYVIRVDMEFRPSRIGYQDLNRSAAIPLSDQLIDRALLPLCEVRLLRSPEWGDKSLSQLVLEEAATARALVSQQRSSVSVPNNQVGTPAGW